MNLVDLIDVSARNGRTLALESVSLRIDAPGAVTVLGPNAAGKSTLLRLLATVQDPTAGQLRLLGRDPSRGAQRTEIRRRLGYLPQDPGLYRGFSAFDLVDYVAVLKEMNDRRTRHREVRDRLEEVGLGDVMHRKVRALSGGARHRVALAAALLGAPELVILDEPAAGLDPETRADIRDVVHSRARSSVVLTSSHHLDDAALASERIVVMRDGRVAFDGTPRQLAALAGDEIVKRFDSGERIEPISAGYHIVTANPAARAGR